MENATKALLIAAAVLIVMLIISLGLYIYSSNSNSEEAADQIMGELQIETFNKKYTYYEGIRHGSEVRALLNMAAQNNASLTNLYTDGKNIKYCVCIRSKAPDILKNFTSRGDITSGLNGSRSYGVIYPENIKKISDSVSVGERYNVWFEYGDYGYVWAINIDSVGSNK